MSNLVTEIKTEKFEIQIENDSEISSSLDNSSIALDIYQDDIINTEIDNNLLSIEIGSSENSIIEIEETNLSVDFPQQIVINNVEAIPVPTDDARTIVETYEVGGDQVQVNRAVVVRSDGKIEHADKDTISDENDIIGVSRQSGSTGQLVEVVEFGRLSGASLGSVGDNYYLGNNGVLTTTPASSGFWVYIGTQIRSDQVLINLGEPIRRV